MTQFTLTPRAMADLAGIWDYTEAEWGLEQAERYTRVIEAAVMSVALQPETGKTCDEIRAGYWKYRAGSHVLFFRRVGEGIEIVRILHQHMDFERHL